MRFFFEEEKPPDERGLFRYVSVLDLAHIDSLEAFRALLGVKADCIALGKRLKAVALDR